MPNWFHRNYMWIFGVASGIVFYQKLSAFYLMLLLLLVVAGALTYYRNWRALNVLLIALFLGLLSAWINDLTRPAVLLKGHCTLPPFKLESSFNLLSTLKMNEPF